MSNEVIIGIVVGVVTFFLLLKKKPDLNKTKEEDAKLVSAQNQIVQAIKKILEEDRSKKSDQERADDWDKK